MESEDGNKLFIKYYTCDKPIKIYNYHTHEDNLKQFEEIKYEPKIYKPVNHSSRKNKFIQHDSQRIQSYATVNFELPKNIREKFSIKTKPIQKVRGDLQPLGEIDDKFILKNDNSNEITYKKHEIRNEYRTVDNILMNYISKDELKIMKERDPTPKDEKTKLEPEEELHRGMKKSHTTHSLHKLQKTTIVNKLHKIVTDEKSIIKLPPDYITDDIDLKIFCDLINEPNLKWQSVLNEKSIQIFKKNIVIRTIAVIDNYSRDDIFEAISNVNIRKQWDKIFSEFKIVETNEKEQFEVLYMAIKSQFPLIDNRDFVQRRKIWKNFPDETSTLLHFKSVDHKDCPIYKKTVRAETIISGYFIKTLSIDPPKTFLSIISQNDIKGKIPTTLVNRLSQTAPKDWVKNLLKGCEMVKQKKIK